MAGPVTIDLGELPHGEPAAVEEAWPVRERLRRMRPRHLRWAAAAAGIAALVLATTGAATSEPLPALTLRAVIPHAGFALDQENLYVLEAPEHRIATGVTAYALDTGTVRWRIPLPETEHGWLQADGALLLVTGVTADDGLTRDFTTRLDPDTGRRLWSREGVPRERSGDLLLLSRPLPADIANFEWPARNELTAVNLATGDPAWTRALPGWPSFVPGDPARLVTLGSGGRLELYDFQTGRPVGSAPVTAPDRPEVVVAGPVAFLFDPQAPVEFTAYDPDTLTRLWTFESDGSTWPQECGRLVCLSGADPVRAIQPATGETVWSAGWLPEGSLTDPFQAAEPDHATLDGYLQLTHTHFDGRAIGGWLIDADTGEPVLDLGRWVLAPSFHGPAPEDPMATWHGDRVIWIGRLRPDLSGVDPIGAIEIEVPVDPDAPYSHCLIPDGLVLCESYPAIDLEAAVLRVWRIR